MRIPTIPALLIVCTVTAGSWGGQLVASQLRPQDVALQAAIRTETIEGDPRAAASQFRAIVDRYPGDRRVVALALVHLADCLRKIGDTKARDTYVRVVKEFADQAEAVRLARLRLESREDDLAPVRRVWTLPADVNLAGRVAWNGRLVAFVDWSDAGAGDLFLRDLMTGASRRLTRSNNRPGSAWDVFVEGGAIARDGSQMAYEWSEKDRAELRILKISEPIAPPRVLPRDPAVTHIEPRDWSGDGRWIAALWRRSGSGFEIGMISTADGSLRPLAAVDQACACWGDVALSLSSDGRYLAFHRPGIETRTRDIFVVPTTGGAVSPAVVYAGDDALVGWSPEGRSIVFKSDRAGSAGLWTVPIEQGRAGQPLPLKLDIGAFSPMGTTASGAVYGCRCESKSGSDIKIASLDFETGRFTSPPTDAVQEYVGTNSQPFWSHDGRYFMYRSIRPNQDQILVIRSADTLGIVKELRPKFVTVSDPRWAPDDRTIAVIGRTFDNKFGYYRIDVETGKPTPIIFYPSPGNRMGPREPTSSWSADGRKFYVGRTRYTVPDRVDEEMFLTEVDVATGEERILSRQTGTGDISGVLSVDGGTVYYRKATGTPSEFAIVALNLATGTEREVVRRLNLGGISRSPDGRWLSVATGPTKERAASLLLVPVDAGEPVELWQVPGAPVAGAGPQPTIGGTFWAPDSRSVLTRKMSGGRPEVWWLSVDGRRSRQLEELNGMVPVGLRIHPDGKRLLFAATVAGAAEQQPKPTEVWVWEQLLAPVAGGKR